MPLHFSIATIARPGRTFRFSSTAVGAVVALFSACALGALPQASVTAVGISGQAAPGVGPGITFGEFFKLGITPTGDVFMNATLTGNVTAANDRAFYVGKPGNLALLVREGDPIPGEPGLSFGTLTVFQFGTSGATIFNARDSANKMGIWFGTPGNVGALMRVGAHAPGTDAGVTFLNPGSEFSVSGGGQALTTGTLTGAGVSFFNDTGVWYGTPGNMQLLARESDIGQAGAFPFAKFRWLRMSNAGTATFQVKMDPNDPASNEEMYYGTPGNIQLMARTNGVAPGTGGATFASFAGGDIQAFGADQYLFEAYLKGAGVDATNDQGLFAGTPTNLQLLLRKGQQAAGLSAGVVYGSLLNTEMSANNRLTMEAFVTGGGVTTNNDDCLWSGPVNQLQLIAREDELAPDSLPDVRFANFGIASTNRHGQAAFEAFLRGPGISGAAGNHTGVWAIDPFGDRVTVGVVGQQVQLAPGDVRTVKAALTFTGSNLENGAESPAWNDASQLGVYMKFADGSVADIVARVGGTARLSPNAPIFGPAVTNAYGLVTPIGAGETVAVSGDVGYIRFAVDASPVILLDLEGSSAGADAVLAELQASASAFGFTVAPASDGFDLEMTFVAPGRGFTSPMAQNFYWNIANIDNVDLTRVRFVPEPCAVPIICAVWLALMRRRGRASCSSPRALGQAA